MQLRKLVPFLAVSISVFCGGWNAVAQDCKNQQHARDASEPENGVVMVELPEGKGRGTGTILAVHKVDNENEVLILTAYHVVQEYISKQQRKTPVRFYRNPSPFWAEIIDEWVDTEEDLAVIRVKKQDVPATIRSLQFGNVDSIRKNSPVVAIGHRVDGGNETWLTDHGLVAQPVGPRITFSRATADRGFSGGPLLDSNGEVVGMVEEVQGGLGYARNLNLIQVFLQGLRDKGVTLESVPPSLRPMKVNLKDGLRYVWIRPGTFQMGCSAGDEECLSNEPAHRVTLTQGFWMGQTEVTVAAYKTFARSEGVQMPPAPDFNPGWSNSNMPILNVSWNEARAYCTWIGGRLPTEAEWEYAARAGSTASRYGSIDDVAWYSGNTGGRTFEVCHKPANAWNLFDMLGNAYEWVSDWYADDYYLSSPEQDPQGPVSGTYHVVRGGSWKAPSRDARASHRGWYVPGVSEGDGFRCVGKLGNP